jgi:hypothetical protein
MPFDGSARRPETPREPQHPPEVLTWTPRAFSPPVSPAAAEWGRFLLALGFGLILFGAISLLLLGL